MKKLFVLVVVAALVLAGRAASVDWSMTVSGQGTAWTGAGAYVMAFSGSDYDAVIDLLTVAGSDDMAAALGGYAVADKFLVGNSRKNAVANGSVTGFTGDTLFWVVFTDGSMDGGKSISWTEATSLAGYTYEAGSPSPGSLGLNAASFAHSGTIADVPEPTSGLLMLVGLAGLALRRRRA